MRGQGINGDAWASGRERTQASDYYLVLSEVDGDRQRRRLVRMNLVPECSPPDGIANNLPVIASETIASRAHINRHDGVTAKRNPERCNGRGSRLSAASGKDQGQDDYNSAHQ
jgi:hypothetical protein